jgi:ADP-ribosylglycohydrolase
MDPRARYRGSLLGLAAGDALGTTLEFRSPGSFEPITDIVGGGPFNLPAGAWTDDTSMALCLAESLIECRGFDPADQMKRYCRWREEGYFSSTGRCFDIGVTTARSLNEYRATGEPFSGRANPDAAGNGSIMRLAPVPLAFAADPRLAHGRAADSSRTTHGAAECLDACRYLAGLIVGALTGLPKSELLAPHYSPVAGVWKEAPLAPKIAAVAAGSFRERQPPAIRGSGYVVASLEAALWAFHNSDNFRDGALLAVNLGDDADTTGAVYGQLAGAYYGEAGIPDGWRQCLVMRETIETLADGLFDLANRSP